MGWWEVLRIVDRGCWVWEAGSVRGGGVGRQSLLAASRMALASLGRPPSGRVAGNNGDGTSSSNTQSSVIIWALWYSYLAAVCVYNVCVCTMYGCVLVSANMGVLGTASVHWVYWVHQTWALTPTPTQPARARPPHAALAARIGP